MLKRLMKNMLKIAPILTLLLSLNPLLAQTETAQPLFSSIGMSGSIDEAAKLKEAGAEFLTVGVQNLLVPDKSDEEFQKLLQQAKDSPLPVLACNSFIRPKHLRCVGEEANHDEVLEWADITFKRAKQVGAKFIVFGSGGSRYLKDGWTKEQADVQFVDLLKKMAPLARQQGITVVLEQLNKRECNYITTVGEAAAIVREVNDPNIRLLADLYHMAMMNNTPEDLAKAMDVVVHIEIAEQEGRAFPGTHGEDFREFFNVLQKANYQGAISIEGRRSEEQPLSKAFTTIRQQAKESGVDEK